MKLHIITIGEPKLAYAKLGWTEYIGRLGRYHAVRTTHINDKQANDSAALLQKCGKAYKVALDVDGRQMASPELADFLEKRALEGGEICFIIGGPDGLPKDVVASTSLRWSLSALTFPHDLAMVVVAEALYRAGTISAGRPYHK